MISKFEANGYEIVGFDEMADIYIINTCTVTSMSDKKSRQAIRRAKKVNEDSIVVVTRLLCSNFKRRGIKNFRSRFDNRK